MPGFRAWRRGAALLAGALLLGSHGVFAQAPARPERIATDAGGGNLPGISAFELHQRGLFWWKTGAQANEIYQREGTLAVKPALGLLGGSLILAGPSTRYLGRGYGFRIDGAVRDDLTVAYAANGYLRRKPLATEASDALDDRYRIVVEQVRPPFGIDFVPVSANGAVMLWKGDLWYSHAEGGTFSIRRPGGLVSLTTFSGVGGVVTRMAVTEVRSEDGQRAKDALVVLTRDGLLYRFDFDPVNTTPVLLARRVWDFAIRQESNLIPAGGFIGFRRVHTTAIYAAVGDLSTTRETGRLLRISARDGSVGVEYDTRSRDLQVRGVAADESRIFLTVTSLSCGGLGCLYQESNGQILSRFAPANSDLIFGGSFATIADRTTVGGPLEGLNLRADGRWVYWITGDGVWRLPGDAKPIERDFEATGIEVVQTTQDLDNTTRLVAGKPTVVRAYARVAKDSLGAAGHPLAAGLQVYHDGVPLSAGYLRPVNAPVITAASDLSNLRTNLAASFLFELPPEWVQRGQLRAEFTVNPGMGIPETGQDPLANNTVATPPLQVIQMGSPCLVFVPIHTGAPNYDPLAPGSGFADILARAESMLPVSSFRYVIKGDRISKPVPTIKFKDVLGVPIPYPAIDYQSFVTEDGFSGALFWLRVYSTFERDPRDCDDTHYVGTVHAMANTTKKGSTSLGLATRPDTGVAGDLVVKMEPPGAVPNNPVWMEPRGGETLAHELSHNYTVRHVDQTVSPLMCGGGKPDGAGGFPCDTCTIGIVNGANLNAELQGRATQYGFDPLTWTPIAPNAAADLMTYRPSKWLSKHTLDLLFGRIPGFQAGTPARAARRQAPPPDRVILVNGTLDLAAGTVVLWPCYRLPADAFDGNKVLASLDAEPQPHPWRLRFLGGRGEVLSEFPIQWLRQEDGDRSETSFVQFVPDQPGIARMQVLRGDQVVTQCAPSPNPPGVELTAVRVDLASRRLDVEWNAADPDRDPLTFVLQYSPDDGVTWHTLQVGYPDQSYSTSLRWLRGGERCRVRVIATDGFHSTAAESGLFVIPGHVPEVVFDGLRAGDRWAFGDARRLHAIAYDAEDGALDPTGIQWQLTGAEERTSSGASFTLRDLAPGAYTVRATAVDSTGTPGQMTATFEVLPLEIREAAEPVLDGECGDTAYAGSPWIRVPLGNGDFALARLIHAHGALWIGVTELAYGAAGGALANVGVRTTRDGENGETLLGFFVDEGGIPFATAGDQSVTPEAGFAAAVGRGESRWSAEFRIADSLLGGWNRRIRVMLSHSASSLPKPDRTWPAGASAPRAPSWAVASAGAGVAPSNRPPIAVVGRDRTVTVRPGDRVFLDGSASRDPEGAPLTFRWTQVDGPPIALSESDGPTPFLVVDRLAALATMAFRLVTRDGSLDSDPVETRVTLIPAVPAPDAVGSPAGAAPSMASDGFAFTLYWPGEPGDQCVVQGSEDLVVWQDLGLAQADYLGLVAFSDAETGRRPHRFYRAIAAPPPADSLDTGGYALRFRGQLDFVQVNHHPDLQPFPFSLAFWLRTSDTGAIARGLVTKYSDSSFNGYSLFLSEGRIRGWYFAAPGRALWDGALGFDSGFVANGTWHHVVLVVDPGGGRLFIDGALKSALTWTGQPGAPSSVLPLQIGRYSAYPESFAGLLDEVAIWNRALSVAEIAALGRTSPRDLGAGLVADWPFDEGGGNAVVDRTGQGHDGILVDAPAWEASDAPWFP